MEIRSSVDEACRLCLRGEGKISVFDDDSKERTITPENIYDCVSVKITRDDKLPKGICESCVKSVKSWCSFKNTCDETQKTLQGWLVSGCAGRVSKKEIVCFPTQKENIKNSSCNTYKITERINCNDRSHVPCTSDAKDLDTVLYPEGRPEVKSNVNGLANIECNGPSLPRTSESNSSTDLSSERVELPKLESQLILEEANSKNASDWGSLFSKPVEPFDISDLNSPLEDNIHIVNSNTSVNILNETNQASVQGDSNILNCRYDVINDKESKYDITNDIESKYDVTNDEESKCVVTSDKESKSDLNGEDSKYDVVNNKYSKCDVNDEESKYYVTNNEEIKCDVNNEESKRDVNDEESKYYVTNNEEIKCDVNNEESKRDVNDEESKYSVTNNEEIKCDVNNEESKRDVNDEESKYYVTNNEEIKCDVNNEESKRDVNDEESKYYVTNKDEIKCDVNNEESKRDVNDEESKYYVTKNEEIKCDVNNEESKHDVNDEESKYYVTNKDEIKCDVNNEESKRDENDEESKYYVTNIEESKCDVNDEESKYDVTNDKESKYDVTNNKENSNDKIVSSSEIIEANSKDGSDYSLQGDQQFNDESISESDNATSISLEKISESSLDNRLLNTDEFSSSSCKEETAPCINFNMLDQRNFAETNLSSGIKAPNLSESLIENNNSIENGVTSAVMDLLSEITEKIESHSSNEEGKCVCVGSNSHKISELKTHTDETTKMPTNATLVDSDNENSTPNLSFDANSNRSDDSKDKQLAYIRNENSVEGEGFSEIRIESTGTLTIEHEFAEEVNASTDQQDLHHSNDNSDSPQLPTQNEEDINKIDDLPSQISKSQLESSNIEVSDSLQQNIPLENSSLTSEVQSENLQNEASIQNQSKQPDELSEARSVPPSTIEQEPMENSVQSLEQTSEDSQFIPPLSVNIKQEPIEPPPEEDTPTERLYNIRVKSEFSSFDYEEETNEYETIDNVAENCSPDERGASQDSLNTECHICHRRYSSVSNYLKHLQTKVHLYNASIGESSRDELEDDNSRDSPMLRSRLSGEPLNSSVDGLFITQSLTPSSSTSPRKKAEHCDLCNTSFGYISELRRHLLSKKHRDNERYLKETQSPPAKKVCFSSSPTQNENRSIFICPIDKCCFSCVKGSSLLTHMKIHGIEQPTDIKPDENVNVKPKLSARQQDLLKKEAEKRKQQQQQQIQLQQQQQQQLQQKQLLQQQQQQQIQLQLQLQQGLEEEEYVDEYSHVPPGYARDYECEGCHKTFFRESGLRKHTHYCNAFSQNEYVEQNKQEGASREAPDNTKSQMHCPLCDLSFASKSVFFSHVQIYHKGSNLESGLLKLHKKASVMQVNNKLRVNKKGLGFVCNICGKKFNLLSSLNFHLKSHTVSVKHICRICKEGFSSRKAFMEHCRLHFLKPGSKETLCHKCFKVFKTRSELYYHRKNDMCSIKLKIYSCNMCQHSFKEPSALEEHKVRFHSESIDMSEDGVHSSSVGELYDDSFIPMNPLSLLSSTNENLGTLPNPVNIYSNTNLPTQSNKNLPNYNNKNPSILNNKVNSMPYNPKPPSKSPFHCDICVTDYATKQTLRKHIKKFHILNLPYMGSKRRGALRKGNVLQANAMKQWKCRHCKTGFGSRKMLVLHLKKCQYNVLDLAKGMCLQCGKWCESGKTRICRFCLPDLAKASKSHPSNFIEESILQRPDYQGFSGYKRVKQEFVGHQLLETSNDEYLGVMNPGVHYLDFSSQQRHQGAYSTDKFSTTIKTEGKDIPQTNTNIPKSSSNVQRGTYKQGNQQIISSNIKLMKCPIGNKYFRNEMIMIKHYSQCDGSCENRCSHCRKMFNSPKEYRNHLVNSKCFGPKRTQARMKYPSFGSKRKYTRKQEIPLTAPDPNSTYQTQRSNVDESIDRIPDNSSDVTVDMSTLEGSISEENSIGPESSISVSVNRVLEEKSLKIGRICTLCDKVINMQRAIYRHVYGCFKIFMLSQESVTCRKCSKTFSKLNSMKENTAAMRQHVLDCHFIPYYVGEGLAEDGSRLNTPPPLLCYVCSFGFTSHITLQKHIKDHRARKDETNNVVLQLEDELLSDERLADENKKFSLYLEVKNSNLYTVRTGRVLCLQDSPPDSSGPRPQSSGRKIFQCDKCSRNFTNRNKFLRHKKVHGIVKQSVLHEVTENIIDFMNENAPSNNLS